MWGALDPLYYGTPQYSFPVLLQVFCSLVWREATRERQHDCPITIAAAAILWRG